MTEKKPAKSTKKASSKSEADAPKKKAPAPKRKAVNGKSAKKPAAQKAPVEPKKEPKNSPEKTAEYQVLARKYRPDDFSSLIGQEAMVRTLSNAIDAGRLAHAFVLTGVRGVGKTTTARIIAKALNCAKSDGPTTTPCGTCEACEGIAQSRHVDVLEMDAASRTGVGDIREIIESVRYAPVSARFKIYIIDEVHMLSTAAFNALLKTLEEPPEHVKFIFATTEIRKIPVTVLSRCQRFDLKRVEASALITHLDKIAKAEGATVSEEGLALIARAAEGSVRDSLSLLDQAIAHAGGDVGEEQIRAMLGLADRAAVIDLFRAVMKGDVAIALQSLRHQYDSGGDPGVIMNDLLELTHWLTRLKVVPDAGDDALVSPAEKEMGAELSKLLAMSTLTRAWQILLKGLGEVRVAPSPIAAAEMVIIRLAYAAELPPVPDLVKRMQSGAPGATAGAVSAPSTAGSPAAGSASVASHMSRTHNSSGGQPTASHGGKSATVLAMQPTHMDGGDHPAHPMPVDFEALVALFKQEREGILANVLTDHVKLVSYAPGRITVVPTPRMPKDFVLRVKQCLKLWTDTDWIIAFEQDGGGPTVREKQLARAAEKKAEALEEPIVKAFLKAFPEARLRAVKEIEQDNVLDDGEALYDEAPVDDEFEY